MKSGIGDGVRGIRSGRLFALCDYACYSIDMITFDDKQIRKFEKKLSKISKRAIPFAVKNSLNDVAFKTRTVAQGEIGRKFIERNKWSRRSVQVETARGLSKRSLVSRVGSLEQYMADQEFGARKRSKGRHGVPIATNYSSGEGVGSGPRKRLPRKPNKIRNIKLSGRNKKGMSRKQRNLIAIRQAAGSNKKIVFLDLKRRKGLFKVIGGKRRPKLKMLHDMTRKSVRIPKRPWLLPSAIKTQKRFHAGFYRKRLRQQLARIK